MKKYGPGAVDAQPRSLVQLGMTQAVIWLAFLALLLQLVGILWLRRIMRTELI